MPLSSKTSYQPITEIEFSGLHLIEASAGTGKTYTLSSLMVRIFLERYLPKQVIATTFTRAAAAELKTRIRLRVQHVYSVLNASLGFTEQEVIQRAEQEADPLLQHILKQFAPRMGYAAERLKLVLDQLDELFVGTLDSFSQKLLREFAFESGKIEAAAITDDAKRYTRQLVHDVLRAWINAQPQAIIDGLYNIGALKRIDDFVDVVEQALNFSSAQFDPYAAPQLNVEHFYAQLRQAQSIQLDDLLAYTARDGEFYGFINGTSFRNDAFHTLFCRDLPQLLQALEQPDLSIFEAYLGSAREAAYKFLEKYDQNKIFKKCSVAISDGFYQHPAVLALVEVLQCLKDHEQQFTQLHHHLKAYLCHEVKNRLPEVLQEKGETTFSQQIRTLSEALKGEQGQRFAQYVQSRYPLILVDEFQDTNQDQDDMLASIWRHPQRYQNGCMIMVGDRKQAIYGFRGGDMLTFLNAHQDIMRKQGRNYKLVHNHRSVRPLVEVVDALFQRQPDFGEQVLYDSIEAGQRAHPALIDQGQHNPAPLRWLMLEDKNREAEQVSWKIRALLNQAHRGELYLDEPDQQRGLISDDIAVISKNHKGLDDVQARLEYLGIKVNRPSRRSVFDHALAHDVAAFLTAILHPYDEAKVKRALLGRMIGLDLSTLQQLQQQASGLSQYMTQFDAVREIWMHQGFLPAWQHALAVFQVWQNLVKIQRRDNERAVVNVRHLGELLTQHSERYAGAQNLYHWYLKQLTSPSEREWELERKLSSDAGVQLMTIHQSKGLEFKVVFLLGADKPFREQSTGLNFSELTVPDQETGALQQRRLVSIADKARLTERAQQQHSDRAKAEQNRLWYVALTRASHRVYAVMQDAQAKSQDALAYWKHQGEAFFHPYSMDEPCEPQCPLALHRAAQQQTYRLYAQPLQSQRFYPRGKTSFSYLAQHLKPSLLYADTLALTQVPEQQADDERDLNVSFNTTTQLPLEWIKQHFPKGPQAGNFLHEIFEHIDLKKPDEWPIELRRRFKNDYSTLWEQLYRQYTEAYPEHNGEDGLLFQWLTEWLMHVATTPLHQGFQLNQLEAGQYLSECPFYLALSDRVLAMRRIQQLFAEYDIHMPDFLDAHAARYLNGSIDLMYFDGQHFHIADYKSNYLGSDQQDYSAQAIQHNMTQSSYWLQAALYLVALHRYLKVKLQHYQIEQHLGGATYLYLRGMTGAAHQGYFYWKPDNEFILRLDAILGYFAEDKMDKKSDKSE